MSFDHNAEPTQDFILDAAEVLHELLEQENYDDLAESDVYFSLICTRAAYHENPDQFIKYIRNALDAALYCPEFDQAMTEYQNDL